MSDDEQNLMADYRRLHDKLSDMIEGGRLTEDMIPDDYRWLVGTLAALANQPSREDVDRETWLAAYAGVVC